MSTIGAIRAQGERRIPVGRPRQLGPRPQRQSLAQHRPRPFQARPRDVLAIAHDGTADRARALVQWVNADRAGGQATGYLDRDGVTVLIHVDGEPALLRVGPGQYLVWNRDVAARWGAYEAEEFEMRFVPRAWEMPIFDDGEIGS